MTDPTLHSPLPEGYKRTEVGVIPEDWEVCKIQDIAQVKTGPFGSALHKKDYVDDGTPIITVEHIGELGIEGSNEDIPKVSDTDKQRLMAYELRENDIVFSRVGAIDRNTLITSREAGWLFSGRLLRVRPNEDKIYSPYLSYHFHTNDFKARVKSVAVGQTMASLNTAILKSISIVIPPLPEQRAIAGILSDVDAWLTALDKLIAKKRAVKQAAMQDLLTGRVRLPGFSGEWKVRKLGEIGDCLRGVSYNGQSDLADYDMPNTIRLLRANNIQNQGINFDDLQFVREEKVSDYQILRKYDIVICMANGSKALVGKAAQFNLNDGKRYTFGAFMGCFRANEADIYPPFAFNLFLTAKYREYLQFLLTGSSINNLKPSDIENMEFVIPTNPVEQRAIAGVLSDMDAEIEALERQRAKGQALKQGLMQELLTGRIRVVGASHTQNVTTDTH